jgi:hypothetical protein
VTLSFSKRRAHECTAPVTNAVEGYSPEDGRMHGSLDRSAYVCPDHIDTARSEYMDGLTPYTAVMRGTAGVDFEAMCGEITDFHDEQEAL